MTELPRRDYDDYPLVDDLSTRYTRRNVEAWLQWWPDFFNTERAETSISWAGAKADVLNAVAQQPHCLRETFGLISLGQLTFWEAGQLLGIRAEAVKQRYYSLVANVVDVMLDRTEREAVISSGPRPFIPASYAVSWEARWGGDPIRRN